MTDVQLIGVDVEYVLVGPVTGAIPGPPGPTAVSADDGNTATLGTDDLIFVPPFPLVVQNTEPTADDYQLDDIPVGAVWIQSPT